MDQSKAYQRRSFWIITLFSLVVSAGAGAGIYYGLNLADTATLADQLVAVVPRLRSHFAGWVMPAVVGILVLPGWILWLLLCLGTAGLSRKAAAKETAVTASDRSGKKDFLDQKIEQERKQRLFLHTLSVLQREGRLLDFFDEDLKQYSDEQIGAAVRSIQADCKQAVKKYIDPRPVVDVSEGEAITVEPGFDMNAITLVGNVTGNPPFEGIVKHPGWKAGKKEVPRLADIPDAAVITPAEIEVRAGD